MNTRFTDFIFFVYRFRYQLIAAPIIASLITVIFLASRPQFYESTVTLVYIPPKFETQLRGSNISIRTYQRLAHNPIIIEGIQKSLGIPYIDPKLLRTRVEDIQAERTLHTPVLLQSSPAFRMIVMDLDPARAQKIANTWASLFLQSVGKLASFGQSASYEFIRTQYEKQREQLERIEDTIAAFNARHNLDLLKKDLHLLEEKTNELYRTHRENDLLLAEKRKMLTFVLSRMDSASVPYYVADSLMRERIKALYYEKKAQNITFEYSPEYVTGTTLASDFKKRYQDIEVKLRHISKTIDNKTNLLAEYKAAKTGTPIVLRYKAGLISRKESLNPVYLQLSEKISDTEIELNQLLYEREQLIKERDALQKGLAHSGSLYVDVLLKKEQLSRNEKLATEKLNSDQTGRIELLQEFMQLQSEVERLKIKAGVCKESIAHHTQLLKQKKGVYQKLLLVSERHQRQKDQIKETFDFLNQKIGEVHLASSENYSDFKLFAPANIAIEIRQKFVKTVAAVALGVLVLEMLAIAFYLLIAPELNRAGQRIRNEQI